MNKIKPLLGKYANDILSGIKSFKLIDDRFERVLEYTFDTVRNEFKVIQVGEGARSFGFHLLSNVISLLEETDRDHLIGIEGEYVPSVEDLAPVVPDDDFKQLDMEAECVNTPALLDLADVICDLHHTTGNRVSVTPVQLPNNKFIAVTYNIRGGKLFDMEFNTSIGAYQYALLRVRYAHFIENTSSLTKHKSLKCELFELNNLTHFNSGDRFYIDRLSYHVAKTTPKTVSTVEGNAIKLSTLIKSNVVIIKNPLHFLVYPQSHLDSCLTKFANTILRLEQELVDYSNWLIARS